MSLDSEILAAYSGDDAELRQLMEGAHQIEQMQRSPGWQPFRDYLLTRTAAVQRRLVLGNFSSMEEYKDKAGWLRGITDAVGENEFGESLVLVAIRESLEAKVASLAPEPSVDILDEPYDGDFPRDEGDSD